MTPLRGYQQDTGDLLDGIGSVILRLKRSIDLDDHLPSLQDHSPGIGERLPVVKMNNRDARLELTKGVTNEFKLFGGGFIHDALPSLSGSARLLAFPLSAVGAWETLPTILRPYAINHARSLRFGPS